MNKFSLVFLLVLLGLIRAQIVIDLASKVDDFTCFKQAGISQVILRAYHSFGAIDYNAKDNILKSNAVGMATDVYMFPCRGKDPLTQVNQLINYLSDMKDQQGGAFAYATGTIWLDIETNPSPNCSWKLGDFDSNCQFIKALVDSITLKGRAVGIYASHFMWLQILGSADRCNLFTDLPIWYAHYDKVQSFDDWPTNPFGGWKNPTLKQFVGGSIVCGIDVDQSWY